MGTHGWPHDALIKHFFETVVSFLYKNRMADSYYFWPQKKKTVTLSLKKVGYVSWRPLVKTLEPKEEAEPDRTPIFPSGKKQKSKSCTTHQSPSYFTIWKFLGCLHAPVMDTMLWQSPFCIEGLILPKLGVLPKNRFHLLTLLGKHLRLKKAAHQGHITFLPASCILQWLVHARI